MASSGKLKSRYEIREPLGEGGMGMVYRAYDTLTSREVALKTIKDLQDQTALDLFRKECDVQKSLNHPNIVDIYDIGEFERDGARRPYFVMPLLRGVTLDKLIRGSSHRLTVERSIEIIGQVCRGLQAAHDRGLVHRDLKPSNIFVLDDDSVKIIDFGVAHLVEHRTSLGVKGTLLYMAPEQIQMKKPSALSDIFSLGVVCYETLTRRQPFERATREDVANAILHHIPPPASELNPSVSRSLSQVVHAAMAKQPWHRFSSAREFGDALQKALRNEPIERFDPARIQPRIERAQKALDEGEYEFAGEVLTEIEAEGYIHSEITPLRRQIDQALRERTVRQLLDSARRRFKDEEFQLALQKVQEVLDLEPQNTDALTLKGDIENQRSAHQIDGWFRLARQHIENNAYNHARQALQNVLQVKPKDTKALQLLAEVDEREQQYVRLRQEKERLYQAALEAWRKGEVSAALTKLERVLELDRSAPDAMASERGASYQNLYNQVRSDHEALKNSYAEARKLLENQRFEEALAICNGYLEKYTGHALFQALKFDVEQRQRQELSAFIARIDRDVENEPDLDRRVSILKEALAKHPNEHFERAMQLTVAKRDLVNSIVTKAHNLEERGQFAEALGQWEILRNIYSPYPGLDYEIERLRKRRDQQARSEAKARWAEQIDRCLSHGEFARARDLAQSALSEFPDDPDLSSLERLARQGMDRSAEAQRLLEQARQLRQDLKIDEALETLRRAMELDERSSAIRSVLVEALLARARALLETEWRRAEPLTQEALDLDPGNALAKSIRLMIQDRKRAEAVDQAMAEARELQASGDLEAALACLERGLASDPQEPRLLQFQASLSKLIQESQRVQARRKDLDEMRDLERKAEAATDAKAADQLFSRTHTLASQYPQDPEFRSLFDEIEKRLTQFRRPSAAAAAPSATQMLPAASGGAAPAPPLPPGPSTAPGPAPREPAPVPEPPRAGVPLAAKKIPGRYWLMAATAAAVLALIAVLVFVIRHTSATATEFPLEIRTTPANATIRINGREISPDKPVQLARGSYTIEAVLSGYEPVQRIVNVPAENAIALVLEPISQVLRLTTDLNAAKIALDEQPPADIQDGQFQSGALAPGRHSVKVIGAGRGEAVIGFHIAPGALPATEPPAAKDLRVVLVTTYKDQAHVRTSFGPLPATIDGQSAGQAGPDGLTLNHLAPGAHELRLGEGRLQRTIPIELTAVPAISASVISDRNVGDVEIITGQDGFDVFVDDKPYRIAKQRGRFFLRNLEAREHSIRIQKNGYRSEPAEQTVEIQKGITARLAFRLEPIPTSGTVQVKGLAAGSQLLIDGQMQTLQPDGSVQATLSEGQHTVELQRPGYRPKTLRRLVASGQTIELTAADFALEKLPTSGTIVLTVVPRDARVTYRQGSGQEVAAPSAKFELPEGTYTFKATAPNYQERTETVELVAGETATVAMHLPPVSVVAVKPADPMEGWVDPKGWNPDAGWYKRKGGGFVLYKTKGLFQFTARRADRRFFGSRRLQWVVNYVDQKNYILFQIDKEKVSWRTFSDGKPGPETKVPHHGVVVNDAYQLQIDMRSGRVETAVYNGKDWQRVDGGIPSLPNGRFGFFVPGNDEVWINEFRFSPAR